MSTGFLREVERQLDLPVGMKADVMRELESHYDELRAEVIATGIEPDGAAAEAERRLGSPSDIAARLTAIHNTASWKSAILAAAPFLAFAVVGTVASVAGSLASACVLYTFGTITAAGSIREIARGRRPVWLATWLAAAMLAANQIIGSFVPMGPHDTAFAHRPSLVAGLGLSLMMIAASLAAGRWQRLSAVLAITYTLGACYILSGKGAYSALWEIAQPVGMLTPVILVVFSRCLFEAHPYGTATQASLFLLATVTLAVVPNGPYSLACVLACGAAVVVITRAAKRERKVLAMKLALYLWSFVAVWGTGWTSGAPWLFNAIGQAVSAWFFYAFNWIRVFVPVWVEHDQRRSAASAPELGA